MNSSRIFTSTFSAGKKLALTSAAAGVAVSWGILDVTTTENHNNNNIGERENKMMMMGKFLSSLLQHQPSFSYITQAEPASPLLQKKLSLKKKLTNMTLEEKWDYFTLVSINPGEDDDDEEDDDDDVSNE